MAEPRMNSNKQITFMEGMEVTEAAWTCETEV